MLLLFRHDRSRALTLLAVSMKSCKRLNGLRFFCRFLLCGFLEWCNARNLLAFGLCKFIRRLHVEPKAGMRSKRRRQAQRHLRRDARAAIENLGKSHTRNVKMLRNVRNIHPFQVFLKHLAGMRRIVHFGGHIVSLVVIPIIEQNCVFAGKGEGQTIVAVDLNRPMPLASLEPMQSP